MKFVFSLNKTCKNNHSGDCGDETFEKLKTLLDTSDQSQFHLSISHVPNNHKYWVFLYNSNGTHESEVHGKTVLNNKPNDKIKKFSGKIPTLDKLKQVLQ
jgi:hypothetical protein